MARVEQDLDARRTRPLTLWYAFAMLANERADMTPRFPESVFTWLSLVGNAVPPRDPNDEDDDEDEEDEEDEDEGREPAVIREPDEDE